MWPAPFILTHEVNIGLLCVICQSWLLLQRLPVLSKFASGVVVLFCFFEVDAFFSNTNSNIAQGLRCKKKLKGKMSTFLLLLFYVSSPLSDPRPFLCPRPHLALHLGKGLWGPEGFLLSFAEKKKEIIIRLCLETYVDIVKGSKASSSQLGNFKSRQLKE